MLRAGALALLCICGLNCLVACVAPATRNEPEAEHTRADCNGCHEREYRAAPQHVDAKPTRCAACHSETSWQPTQLTHTWMLTGAHAKADCAACHKGWSPQYEHTDRTCGGCHREAFQKAAVPGHEHVLLSSNCQDCHTTQAWLPAAEPRAKAAVLQLSAATPSPVQRAGVATHATALPVAPQPAPPANAEPATLAARSIQGTAASAIAPDAIPASASEPAATPVLGRSTKSPAGKRTRRGGNKMRRPPPPAPSDAPALAKALAPSPHLAARLDPAADARNGAPPATGAKPAASSSTPQPAAARSTTNSEAHKLRSAARPTQPPKTKTPAPAAQTDRSK